MTQGFIKLFWKQQDGFLRWVLHCTVLHELVVRSSLIRCVTLTRLASQVTQCVTFCLFQAQFFQPVAHGAESDAQQLRGRGLVVMGLLQRIQYGLPFDIFKVVFQRHTFRW